MALLLLLLLLLLLPPLPLLLLLLLLLFLLLLVVGVLTPTRSVPYRPSIASPTPQTPLRTVGTGTRSR
jgi:hypothetical protein